MKEIVILASGGGSNARNILNYFQNISDVEVSLIASNNKNAGVLNIAKEHEIPTFHLTRSNFTITDQFLDVLVKLNPDLIVLAGFLWMIPETMVEEFDQKIINIHPSLLPKFGGKGMYGKKVHEAVVEAKEEESGITIHYVNKEYDKGAVIFQKKIKIDTEDTSKDVETKVRHLEIHNFPLVIDKLLKQD